MAEIRGNSERATWHEEDEEAIKIDKWSTGFGIHIFSKMMQYSHLRRPPHHSAHWLIEREEVPSRILAVVFERAMDLANMKK